jgi:hypothetical protein
VGNTMVLVTNEIKLPSRNQIYMLTLFFNPQSPSLIHWPQSLSHTVSLERRASFSASRDGLRMDAAEVRVLESRDDVELRMNYSRVVHVGVGMDEALTPIPPLHVSPGIEQCQPVGMMRGEVLISGRIRKQQKCMRSKTHLIARPPSHEAARRLTASSLRTCRGFSPQLLRCPLKFGRSSGSIPVGRPLFHARIAFVRLCRVLST